MFQAGPTEFRPLPGDLPNCPAGRGPGGVLGYTTPAVARGRFYFRGPDYVYCYDLRSSAAR